MHHRNLILAAACSACLFSANSASAFVTIQVSEVGADVIATYTGSVNPNGLTPSSPIALAGALLPSNGVISWGGALGAGLSTDVYLGLTTQSFGPGSSAFYQALTSGSAFGIQSNGLYVPSGYTSGTAISGSTRFSGHNFSSLGLTPGTYTWTWGSGPNADSAVLTIGSAPSPGPAAAPGPLPLFGAAAAYTWSRRLRRRCGRG
jgi:hypothetical protein